jgi:4-amino-4-deoxy-L-arabinose transferase-like glycosyltransferase
MKKSGFGSLLIISILIWLAFSLRLDQLGAYSLWYDELLELDIAQGPFFQIGPRLIRHAAMPLDYYILYGWVRLGRQEAWVRFPALFFSVLATPLIYVLGKWLFNKRAGYLAAILLTFASFAIDYSQEARPYALLLFLTMLAYLGLWQVYKTGRFRGWVVVIFGLGGAALTHYFTLFMLAPIGLFVAIQQVYHLKDKRIWGHTAYFILTLLLLALIFGLYGRLEVLHSVGGRFASVVNQPETLTLPQAEKPNRGSGPPITREFFVDKVLSPLSTSQPLGILLYNAFFLIAILSLVFKPSASRQIAILLLLGWLILPIGFIYTFLLHRGTFYAVRYILYTLPAYLVLVAYGIDRAVKLIGRERSQFDKIRFPPAPSQFRFNIETLLRHALSGWALLPLILVQCNSQTPDAGEDWRAVGQLLQAEAGVDDAIIAVKAEPTINWYYPPATVPLGYYGRSEPIWQAINQHPRRWFILSSYSFKQDRGLRDWLANQQAVKIAIDRRVVVYFHQEGLTLGEMLAQVKHFALPQKPLTYAVLAEQFERQGDIETSRVFYQKAIELADTAAQRAGYEDRLAALPATGRPVGQ